MYSSLKNVQILIALLKKHGIRNLVLSPGGRNVSFVRSVESDSYFNCFSVTDERSAAFFALGLAQEKNEVVAISCTSSTATANYLSGLTEAFYQGIPILALTHDRNPYMYGQMEDLMIKQFGMYKDVCKKYVQLPVVNTDEDFWYCERLINEAILELDHRGKGPVHINIPTYTNDQIFMTTKLPKVKAIKRYSIFRGDISLVKKVRELEKAKRILVIYGQTGGISSIEMDVLEKFSNIYNCVISVEHMSNVNFDKAKRLFVEVETMSKSAFQTIIPDIVISVGGRSSSKLKALLRSCYRNIKHWSINENGDIIDAYKSLTNIFECEPYDFFKYFVENAEIEIKNDGKYVNEWERQQKRINYPDFGYSNISVIKKFLENIPKNSILHLSILNSIRITQFFDLPKSVKVYANLGTLGIDGSMSTFLGQASVSEKMSFLVIGDLSFFYDMNSLRINHISRNVRILLINNFGGGEFYYNQSEIYKTIDMHTAAKHSQIAKGWVESSGFRYLTASSEEEFTNEMQSFISEDSERPIVFEVFVNIDEDAKLIHSFYNDNSLTTKTELISSSTKNLSKTLLGDDTIDKLRKVKRKLIK